MSDTQALLQEQVKDASNENTPLSIVGGATKDFYGRTVKGVPLFVGDHQGIVDYDPAELVLTARAGTSLNEVQELLEKNNQMLGFEPPGFGDSATLGGVIASGLSGPARPFYGGVRDFVLGAKILTGDGKVMQFGGRVMKNVAGFDVSRLMVGSLGTLGPILEVSIKVLPKPPAQMTISIDEHDEGRAIQKMNQFSSKPWPVSAMSWHQNRILVRLSGTRLGVESAAQYFGGKQEEDGERFWKQSREQTLDFFRTEQPLLRFSCRTGADAFSLDENHHEGENASLIEWAGGVRWFKGENGENPIKRLQGVTQGYGGHWTQFRNVDRSEEIFTLPSSTVLEIQRNLKQSFDPKGIFNVGRLYSAF